MNIMAWDLQERIVSHLQRWATFRDANIAIYDSVPKKAPLPYVAIAESTISPAATKINIGENDSIVFHVWSNYKGKKEVMRIIKGLTAAIYALPMELPENRKITFLTLENANIIEQEEQGLFQGIVTFNFIIR